MQRLFIKSQIYIKLQSFLWEMVATVLCSVILFVVIEEPFRKFGKILTSKPKPRKLK